MPAHAHSAEAAAETTMREKRRMQVLLELA
jgi:hypothetical protein